MVERLESRAHTLDVVDQIGSGGLIGREILHINSDSLGRIHICVQ